MFHPLERLDRIAPTEISQSSRRRYINPTMSQVKKHLNGIDLKWYFIKNFNVYGAIDQ